MLWAVYYPNPSCFWLIGKTLRRQHTKPRTANWLCAIMTKWAYFTWTPYHKNAWKSLHWIIYEVVRREQMRHTDAKILALKKVLIPTSLNFSWRLMCEDEYAAFFLLVLIRQNAPRGFESLAGHIRERLDFFHVIFEVFWGLWLMLSEQSSLCFRFSRLLPQAKHTMNKEMYTYIFIHIFTLIIFLPIWEKKKYGNDSNWTYRCLCCPWWWVCCVNLEI